MPAYRFSSLLQQPAFALSFRQREPLPVQPRATVILLHGVGGNETNLFDIANALPDDMRVILARAPLRMAPAQFAWFPVRFDHTGPQINAEAADASRRLLIQFVEQLQQAYVITADRTVIAGFSQGGILSASVALTAPERVAGFAMLAGRILPELTPQLASSERLQSLQAFIGHGSRDSKLPVSWAQRALALLNQLRVRHNTQIYPIDHGLSEAMIDDFVSWLNLHWPATAEAAAATR